MKHNSLTRIEWYTFLLLERWKRDGVIKIFSQCFNFSKIRSANLCTASCLLLALPTLWLWQRREIVSAQWEINKFVRFIMLFNANVSTKSLFVAIDVNIVAFINTLEQASIERRRVSARWYSNNPHWIKRCLSHNINLSIPSTIFMYILLSGLADTRHLNCLFFFGYRKVANWFYAIFSWSCLLIEIAQNFTLTDLCRLLHSLMTSWLFNAQQRLPS